MPDTNAQSIIAKEQARRGTASRLMGTDKAGRRQSNERQDFTFGQKKKAKKKAAKKKRVKLTGKQVADPSGSMKRRVKATIRKRGDDKVSRQLAKREGLNISEILKKRIGG